MFYKFNLFAALVSFSFVSGCRANDLRRDCEIKFQNPSNYQRYEIPVQISKTESERNRGLMYRDKMEKNQGMLFVFPDEAERSFWMKNTFISLDIIFIDAKGSVKTILDNVPPHSTLPRKSNSPVKFVLELNSGMAKEFGIEKGSSVDMSSCVN